MVDVIDALIDDDLTHYMKACSQLRGELEDAKNIARRLLRERDEARANHKSAEDSLDNLAVKLSEARQNGIQLREERDILQSQVNHLESDRDALARTVEEQRKRYDAKYAEWSELQTESSRRQAEIAALKTLLVDVDKERLELYRALEQVEWLSASPSYTVGTKLYCPFCWQRQDRGHDPICPRQKALGLA